MGVDVFGPTSLPYLLGPEVHAPLNMSTDQLTDSQVDDFREAFLMFDKDKSGSIDSKELATVLRSLGMNPTPQELANMIAAVDKDGSNEIDFEEFLSMMAKKMSDSTVEEELIECFKLFDDNRDGTLDVGVLQHILEEFSGLQRSEIDEMMREADRNSTGQVRYAHLVKTLLRQPIEV